MRKTNKRLREKLDEAIAADGTLASKLMKIVSYIENAERTGEEKRLALVAEIGSYHEHRKGEDVVVRKMLDEVVRELCGQDEPATKPKTEEQPQPGGIVVMNQRKTG